LASAAAQIIELCAPHHAAPHHLDRGDPRRIERKDAFYPFAVGDLAQGEIRVYAGVLTADAYPFEDLDALALALDHFDADPHCVARLKSRYRPVGGEPFDLLLLELLKKVHRFTSRSLSSSRSATTSCAAK